MANGLPASGAPLWRASARREPPPLDRGESPQALDETLDEALKLSAGDLIQSTHWPNIDLIGAQLDLYWAEFQIPVWRMASRGWKLWEGLTRAAGGRWGARPLRLVILDTPPALGYLTINALAAADILLVPARREFSGVRFHGPLLRHAARDLRLHRGQREHGRARLGLGETRFEWDAVRAVLTRYDGGQQGEMAR
jgi:chromosome partitioning protein